MLVATRNVAELHVWTRPTSGELLRAELFVERRRRPLRAGIHLVRRPRETNRSMARREAVRRDRHVGGSEMTQSRARTRLVVSSPRYSAESRIGAVSVPPPLVSPAYRGEGAFVSTAFLCLLLGVQSALAQSSFSDTIAAVQPKLVKIHGAGGFRASKRIKPACSFPLPGTCSRPGATCSIPRTYRSRWPMVAACRAQLVGLDPKLEIAVLKIEAENLPHFTLADAADAEPGLACWRSAISTAWPRATSK